MAYKDEYEVARLYTDGSFEKQVAGRIRRRNLRFEFHLAPPLLAAPRQEHRSAAQDELRAVDVAGVPRCWRSSNSCAARRSIRSAARPSASTERALIGEYEAMLGEMTGGA